MLVSSLRRGFPAFFCVGMSLGCATGSSRGERDSGGTIDSSIDDAGFAQDGTADASDGSTDVVDASALDAELDAGFATDSSTCSEFCVDAGPVDIDECVINHGGCDPRTTCTDTAGSPICGACPTGYQGTGATGCSYLHLYPPQAYIKASNTGSSDLFGRAIALSSDGSTLVVGAHAEDSNSAGVNGIQTNNLLGNSGAVYVFRRDSTGMWAQEAYLKASNPGAGDEFGASLALSATGETLAVGAHFEDSMATGPNGDQSSNTRGNSGAVYVFRRSAGGVWTQEAYLKASNTGASDEFGLAIALSGNGATLAVGAPREDSAARGIGGDQATDAAVDAGAVYVFRHRAGEWMQEAYIKASNADAGDMFGSSVALSEDGARLAAGAMGEDSSSRGVDGPQSSNTSSNSGAVYTFVRSVADVWAQEAYVKASNAEPGDMFGSSITLAADGATLAVGAPFEDSGTRGVGGDEANNDALDAGSVYLFARGTSGWAQELFIKASNADAADQFGSSIAISADGLTLAVATRLEDSNAVGVGGIEENNAATDSGAAYVFARSDGGAWSQRTYVKATNTAAADHFGNAVAVSWDGSTLAVGAPQEDSSSTGVGGVQTNDSLVNSGVVYVYR